MEVLKMHFLKLQNLLSKLQYRFSLMQLFCKYE